MEYERRCAVIPVYNEEKGLENILPSIVKLIPHYLNQAIVVDDGSTDKTSRVVEKYMSKGIILLRHEMNRGKASALKTGIEKAVDIGYDSIILMDGDRQHLPDEIPLLLDKLYEGEGYDLVVGCRDFNKMPFWNRRANIADSRRVSKITKTNIPDSQCGFRVVRSRLFKEGKIKLRWQRFTAEPQMIIESIHNGYKVSFTPISTIYDSERKSNIRVFQQFIDYSLMYGYYLLNGRREARKRHKDLNIKFF